MGKPITGEIIAAEVDQERWPSRKKDTKRWCRGRPGREHVPETTWSQWPAWQARRCSYSPADYWYRPGKWLCNHQIICKQCGKVLTPYDQMKAADCPDFPPKELL